MNTHEFAQKLLSHPPGSLEASIDIDTGEVDEHGDPVIAKLFASSVTEVIISNEGNDPTVTVLFEESQSGGDGVDVISAVGEAQKKKNNTTK